MPVNVYAWPPVAAVGTEWSVVAPISESYSVLSGKRYVSAAKPQRRVTQVAVVSLGRGPIYSRGLGAGYVEMLKRLLAGGQNLVRLRSRPINGHLDPIRERDWRRSVGLEWLEGSTELIWTTPSIEFLWYDGTILEGTLTTNRGFPAIAVTGLPPFKLVARPGEFITVFQNEDDTTGSTAQVLAPAYSNGVGGATIRLLTALAYGGRVNIGSSDTAVFRAVGELPRALSNMVTEWTYGWSFEEVFSDEVGGFTEVADWWMATGTPT